MAVTKTKTQSPPLCLRFFVVANSGSVFAPKDEAIRKILDGRQWLNPYIIVNVNGYELILHDQPRTEVRLNLDELETALLRLPLAQWPLGKVVAVSENGLRVD